MHMELHICFMQADAQVLYQGMPRYASEEAAGMDLRACISPPTLTIAAQERVLVPSGIAVHPICPEHTTTAGFIYSRSGLGAKHGITVAQGVGVIDSDYRGEIMIMLLNTTSQAYTLQRGERVAQLVFQPIVRPQIMVRKSLAHSQRGDGGFGHSGKL